MRDFTLENGLKKELSKLKKKSKVRYLGVREKMQEILNVKSVEHYKNLKKPLQKYKRVHIDSSFVLIFSYNSKTDVVNFFKLDHHDNIYKY
jgi:YafQ family addiction module toxin component